MGSWMIYGLYACFLAGLCPIAALYLRLFVGKRDLLSVCSVALGEVGVKSRIKKAMSYKKPMLWVIIACILLCVLVAVLFLTDPKGEEETPSDVTSEVTLTPSDESVLEVSDEPSAEESSDFEESSEPEESSDESLPEPFEPTYPEEREIVRNYMDVQGLQLEPYRTNTYGNALQYEPNVFFAMRGTDAVVYLADWDEYLLVPDVSDRFADDCAAVFGDSAWLFEHISEQDGDCRNIRVTGIGENAHSALIGLPYEVQVSSMYCHMRGSMDGYLFVWRSDIRQSNILEFLFRTSDGGETWQFVKQALPVQFGMSDPPVVMEFFDRDNGFLFCYGTDGVRYRIRITNDGGETWQLPELDYIAGLLANKTELQSLVYSDGRYVLTVAVYEDGAEPAYTLEYVSGDFKTWELDRNDIPLPSHTVYNNSTEKPLIYMPFHNLNEIPTNFVTAMQNDPIAIDFWAETDAAGTDSARVQALLDETYIPLLLAETDRTIDAVCSHLGERYRAQLTAYRDAYLNAENQALAIERDVLGLDSGVYPQDAMRKLFAYRQWDSYRQLLVKFKYMLYLIETSDGGQASESLRFAYQNQYSTTGRGATVVGADGRFIIREPYSYTYQGQMGISAYAMAMAQNPLDQSEQADIGWWHAEGEDAKYVLVVLMHGDSFGADDFNTFEPWHQAYTDACKKELALWQVLHEAGYLSLSQSKVAELEQDALRQVIFTVRYWAYLYETVVLGNDAEQSLQF